MAPIKRFKINYSKQRPPHKFFFQATRELKALTEPQERFIPLPRTWISSAPLAKPRAEFMRRKRFGSDRACWSPFSALRCAPCEWRASLEFGRRTVGDLRIDILGQRQEEWHIFAIIQLKVSARCGCNTCWRVSVCFLWAFHGNHAPAAGSGAAPFAPALQLINNHVSDALRRLIPL